MTPIEDKPVANFGPRSLATKRGLTLAEDLSFAAWLDIGRRLFKLVDASGWWVGDWLFHGQWQYGKKYLEAGEATGFDVGSLRNMSYVAGRFDLSRRRDNLSFSHHEAVASLKPAEADDLLEQAEAQSWSVMRLREKVREHRAASGDGAKALPAARAESAGDVDHAPAEPLADRLELHLTAPRDRVERWTTAAAAVGKDLETWVREVLDAAATLGAAA